MKQLLVLLVLAGGSYVNASQATVQVSPVSTDLKRLMTVESGLTVSSASAYTSSSAQAARQQMKVRHG